MNDRERREELKRFLRMRRERLTPRELGLPPGSRRRTPGLRREEVAELAGVGVAWYSWLEMGRDIRVSSKMLQGVARALRLTDAETAYLFNLAGNPLPKQAPGSRETIPDWVDQIVRRFDGPAYVVGVRQDVLAWNEQAARLFHFVSTGDPLEANIVWRMCTDPRERELHVDYQSDLEHAIATLRTHYAHHVGNPDFESLIAALQRESADFRRIWPRQHVVTRLTREVRLRLPELGEFTLELVNLPMPNEALQHVAFGYLKGPESLERRFRRYLTKSDA